MTDEINSQEALSAWVKQQFQRANKHLAEKGILFDTVVVEESRYMAPEVAVWKIKDTKKNVYWVISGNLPADAISVSVANSAREAIRHFSLSWQLKAQNIMSSAIVDNTQKEFATLLTEKAEMLYEVQENEKWWQTG
ncbi:DUF4826 domain-containing protein [Glaciecola punicea]|jgi:hypothetical protein|nr:DUF4826 family protein [Glaciecola punicea]OFA31723.1 DUF4826 domain-containing protein [Glaciecola punicea]